jgi:hypothetical protein
MPSITQTVNISGKEKAFDLRAFDIDIPQPPPEKINYPDYITPGTHGKGDYGTIK